MTPDLTHAASILTAPRPFWPTLPASARPARMPVARGAAAMPTPGGAVAAAMLRLVAAALLCALALTPPALAKTRHFASEGGVALAGHDPVAYFTEERATAGDAGFALRWRGVTWYFASAENRAAFEMNPSAYAPQYGGWCPVALSEGRLAAGDPDLFRLRGGKLYLLESDAAAARFEARAPEILPAALAAWKTIPRK